MRHRIKGRKLGRTASHRQSTLRSLATALIKHKKIKTTVAKAKELRTFIEPMITKAKTDSVHARRLIARDINDKEVIKELFTEVVEKVGERPGGYTRVIKLGQRLGDAAEMAIIELVDFNDVAPKKSKKVKEESTEVVEKAEVVEETAKEEATEAEVVEEFETAEEVKDEAIAEEEKVEEEKVEEKTEVKAESKEEKTDEKATDSEEEKKEDK
jgi:large subunit ribosomal protein L17